MREIKFRAWDKTNKEMTTWSSLYDNPNLWEYILSHNEQIENWIGDIVLMQFTGLTDKNGKEIYEGDILRVDDDWDMYGFAAGFVGNVIFENGSFRFKDKYTPPQKYKLDTDIEEGATVIGNIYEHPHLLEESK